MYASFSGDLPLIKKGVNLLTFPNPTHRYPKFKSSKKLSLRQKKLHRKFFSKNKKKIFSKFCFKIFDNFFSKSFYEIFFTNDFFNFFLSIFQNFLNFHIFTFRK